MNRQEHILTIFSEECGEVSKEISKALRFGLDDKLTLDPAGPRGTEGPTNSEKIITEFVQLIAMFKMAASEGILPDIDFHLPPGYQRRADEKIARVEAYLLYSERVGTLQPSGGRPAGQPVETVIVKPWRDRIQDAMGFAKVVHPDYPEDEPPIVRVDVDQVDSFEQYRVTWEDGTTDWQGQDSLEPLEDVDGKWIGGKYDRVTINGKLCQWSRRLPPAGFPPEHALHLADDRRVELAVVYQPESMRYWKFETIDPTFPVRGHEPSLVEAKAGAERAVSA